MSESSGEVNQFVGRVARLGLTQPYEVGFWQGEPYQLCARHDLIKKKRAILSLDKGLGKTSVILSIGEDPLVHRHMMGFTVLVFTNEKGMQAYRRDIKMFPEHADKIQLVYGNERQRGIAWKNSKARYFIVTYASFLSDMGMRKGKSANLVSRLPLWVWNPKKQETDIDMVVCDEFHRVFRRRSSATFEMMKLLTKHVEYFFPMSGSAVSKGPEDLFAVLHLVDRKLWSSYWKYCATWCEIEETFGGKKVNGPRNDRVPQWRAAVRPYLFHCTKDMVGTLPEKVRVPLDVILPKWQMALHDSLWNELFAETPDGEYIYAANTLAKTHKVRLALICPRALSPDFGVGQGIEDIFDDAQESELTRYAIFTPFKAPIPHLVEYLQSRGANVWVLQGGIGLDEQERRLDAWRASLPNAGTNAPSIVLSTVKYAESWEIPDASYGYFLGYEWDPEDNKQAEDRLHRLISKDPVFLYYMRALGTYDEVLLNMIMDKAAGRIMMFRSWGELKKLVRQYQHTEE